METELIGSTAEIIISLMKNNPKRFEDELMDKGSSEMSGKLNQRNWQRSDLSDEKNSQ